MAVRRIAHSIIASKGKIKAAATGAGGGRPTAQEQAARDRGWKVDKWGIKLYWVPSRGRWVSIPPSDNG